MLIHLERVQNAPANMTSHKSFQHSYLKTLENFQFGPSFRKSFMDPPLNRY